MFVRKECDAPHLLGSTSVSSLVRVDQPVADETKKPTSPRDRGYTRTSGTLQYCALSKSVGSREGKIHDKLQAA